MSLSHRNQSINLLCKSTDWLLCERDIDRERVNVKSFIGEEDDVTSIDDESVGTMSDDGDL